MHCQKSMVLRPFQRDDFPKYESWFADQLLNNTLGPIDSEWLEYVLQETDGAQFSLFQNEVLVCVMGVCWSNAKNPFHVLTDLAVHPQFRRLGIGTLSISLLFAYLQTVAKTKWVAYVHAENQGAKGFFESLGWVKAEDLWQSMDLLAFSYEFKAVP